MRVSRWIVGAALVITGGVWLLEPTRGLPIPMSTQLTGRWEPLAPIPEMPRYYVGVATVRGRLFVIGGVSSGRSEGQERFSVHAYDPGTNSWDVFPPLPKAAVMPNVAGVGDQLYVLGALGFNNTWVFDFDRRVWLARQPLPVPQLGSAVVGVRGSTVFLAGGAVRGRSANNLNTGVRQSSLLAYHTATDTWERLPDMPTGVAYASGAVIGDTLWVLGGSTNKARTDQVLAYDMTARRWSTKAPLPVSLSSAPAAAIGNRIYVTGGIATDTGSISAETRMLDPATGVWTLLASLPTPRFATHGAVINGRFYVPAGMKMSSSDPDATPVVSSTLEVFVP